MYTKNHTLIWALLPGALAPASEVGSPGGRQNEGEDAVGVRCQQLQDG